jgi:hypothetical protein
MKKATIPKFGDVRHVPDALLDADEVCWLGSHLEGFPHNHP